MAKGCLLAKAFLIVEGIIPPSLAFVMYDTIESPGFFTFLSITHPDDFKSKRIKPLLADFALASSGAIVDFPSFL